MILEVRTTKLVQLLQDLGLRWYEYAPHGAYSGLAQGSDKMWLSIGPGPNPDIVHVELDKRQVGRLRDTTSDDVLRKRYGV